MASTTTEIIGNLNDFLEKAKSRMNASILESTTDTLNAIAATARQLVPVDTGRLRDNIQASVNRNGKGGVVKISATKAYYGFMVHFGTVKMVGRPFLYQAAEAHGVAEYKERIVDNWSGGE